MKYLKIKDKPNFFYYNNKKVTIVSFFNSLTLPEIVADKQKEVFDNFEYLLNIYDENMRHPTFMNRFLDKHESDIYIFFDIDSIPLDNTVIYKILDNVSDNSIFGVSQVDNNNYLMHTYAAPSCLSFTNNLYCEVGRPSFIERQRYIGNNNEILKIKDFIYENNIEFIDDDDFYYNIISYIDVKKLICDVAEEFTYVLEEDKKYNINLWYPTYSYNRNWKMNGYFFGNGTIYNNSIYHQFQILNKDQTILFLKKCDDILKNLE